VYYQSFNGFGMGWKIRVVDEGASGMADKMASSLNAVIILAMVNLLRMC